MLLECCSQYVIRNGKLSNGHRTGKDQFSLQSLWRAMSKNVQTMIYLHSFHILVKFCSKAFKLGFCRTWTENFQIYKLSFERAVNQRSNYQCSLYHRERKGIPEKTSASLTMLQPLTVLITKYCGKFIKRQEYQTTLHASWETCIQVKK